MKSVLLNINPSWCNLIFFLAKKLLKYEKRSQIWVMNLSNVMFIAQKPKPDGSKSAMDTWNNWTEKLLESLLAIICTKSRQNRIACQKNLKRCPVLGKKKFWIMSEKKGWAWSISNVKLYEHPKFLFEFTHYCILMGNRGVCNFNKVRCSYQVEEFGETNRRFCNKYLKRPPQSWCYVEG